MSFIKELKAGEVTERVDHQNQLMIPQGSETTPLVQITLTWKYTGIIRPLALEVPPSLFLAMVLMEWVLEGWH